MCANLKGLLFELKKTVFKIKSIQIERERERENCTLESS